MVTAFITPNGICNEETCEINSGWALQIRVSIRYSTLTSTTSTGKDSELSCSRDPVAARSVTMTDVPVTTLPFWIDLTCTRRWIIREPTAAVLSPPPQCRLCILQYPRPKLKRTSSASLSSTPMIPASKLRGLIHGLCKKLIQFGFFMIRFNSIDWKIIKDFSVLLWGISGLHSITVSKYG